MNLSFLHNNSISFSLRIHEIENTDDTPATFWFYANECRWCAPCFTERYNKTFVTLRL